MIKSPSVVGRYVKLYRATMTGHSKLNLIRIRIRIRIRLYCNKCMLPRLQLVAFSDVIDMK